MLCRSLIIGDSGKSFRSLANGRHSVIAIWLTFPKKRESRRSSNARLPTIRQHGIIHLQSGRPDYSPKTPLQPGARRWPGGVWFEAHLFGPGRASREEKGAHGDTRNSVEDWLKMALLRAFKGRLMDRLLLEMAKVLRISGDGSRSGLTSERVERRGVG
jgi:hypothetical protein